MCIWTDNQEQVSDNQEQVSDNMCKGRWGGWEILSEVFLASRSQTS